MNHPIAKKPPYAEGFAGVASFERIPKNNQQEVRKVMKLPQPCGKKRRRKLIQQCIC